MSVARSRGTLRIKMCRQTTTTSYKSRICFWDRKKKKEGGDTPDVIERKHRLVVPNHLVPFGPKARTLFFLTISFVKK